MEPDEFSDLTRCFECGSLHEVGGLCVCRGGALMVDTPDQISGDDTWEDLYRKQVGNL